MIRRPPRSPLFPYTTLSRSTGLRLTDERGREYRFRYSRHQGDIGLMHFAPPVQGAAQPSRLRSEEHTSELQSRQYLVCRLLLEKNKKNIKGWPPVINFASRS